MKKTIVKIIKENLAFDEKVTTDTKLNKLSVDSLSFINVLVTIEKTFHITFTDEELNMNNFKIVNDLIELIKRKISKNEKNNL